MKPSRILIFSPAALEAEAVFLCDPAFHVLRALAQETDVFDVLYHTAPDAVLMDDAFPGQDMLRICRRMQHYMAAPPKVIFMGSRYLHARDLGVDFAFPADIQLAALPEAAHGLLGCSVPGLSVCHASLRAVHTQRLLDALGVQPNRKGRHYLQTAVETLSCFPSPPAFSMNTLYLHIASLENTGAAAVEKAIRTAIESTWLSGKLDAISALFGYTVDPDKGKPTNSECMALLAQYVKQKTQNDLLHLAQKEVSHGTISPDHDG